ncbi:hypothetical protein WJX77_012002 [Trebouxia sp. C0004]
MVSSEERVPNFRRPHASERDEARAPSARARQEGAWTVGNLDEFEGGMRIIAEESGHQVYAIEYHLAPEFKYPYQLKEVEAVLTCLANNGKARGMDPSRICIGGDSAGGNMSAVTCLRARDREESGYKGPDLAMQLLLYPETALPFSTQRTAQGTTWKLVECCCLHGTCFLKGR